MLTDAVNIPIIVHVLHEFDWPGCSAFLYWSMTILIGGVIDRAMLFEH